MGLQTNEAYLAWDGIKLSGHCTEKVATRLVTRWTRNTANGQLHQRYPLPAPTEVVWEFNIIYTKTAVPTLQPGHAAMLIWGPQGKRTGFPKQEMFAMLMGLQVQPMADEHYVQAVLLFVPARTVRGIPRVPWSGIFTDAV